MNIVIRSITPSYREISIDNLKYTVSFELTGAVIKFDVFMNGQSQISGEILVDEETFRQMTFASMQQYISETLLATSKLV